MDAVDRMQASGDLETRSRIDRLLSDLERSRQAVRPGGGTCAGCGKPIPAKRLRALPGARRCVGCQLEHERDRR